MPSDVTALLAQDPDGRRAWLLGHQPAVRSERTNWWLSLVQSLETLVNARLDDPPERRLRNAYLCGELLEIAAEQEALDVREIAVRLAVMTTAARRIMPAAEPRPPLVPDTVARTILGLIDVYREDASAWAADWQERPPADRLRLVDAKDLLRPLVYLVDDLADETVRSEVDAWLAIRGQLP